MLNKVKRFVGSKSGQATLLVSMVFVSSVSMAADAISIGDYINAETVAPITESILTVTGIAIGAGFSILGVVVAAKAGMGLIKGFLSRASS